MNQYCVAKYKGKWAILQLPSNVYYFIGKGKKFCTDKAQALNMSIKFSESKIITNIYGSESELLNIE